MLRHPQKKERFGRICRFCVLLAMLYLPMIGTAGGAGIEANTVKAAFVLNLAKYTLWPNESFASSTDPIELWVFGDTTTRQAFGTINGKKIGPRTLHVRFMNTAETTDRCHMIYFSRDVDRDLLDRTLAIVGKMPVLTVGERPDFIRLGGVVNLFSNKGRFHFEIKPDSAHRRGLKISSRLLKLAIIVSD